MHRLPTPVWLRAGASLLLGLLLLAGSFLPAHAQQPVELPPSLDTLEQQGDIKLIPTGPRTERSGTVRKSASLSDLTVLQNQQKFYGAPWPQSEINFVPDGADAMRAGDVNNDGIGDWIYPVSQVGDERTVDPSDRTPKTVLRFGGGDFSAQYYDEIYYKRLQPVGNVVGSSHADALRLLGGGEEGFQLFQGSNQGYVEGAPQSDPFPPPNTAPVDLNGDGYNDLMHGSDNASQIFTLMGAGSADDLDIFTFTPAYDESRAAVFSYAAGDIDGDDRGEIVRLTGDNSAGGPDDSLTVDVFGLNDSSVLVQQESVTVDFAPGTTGADLFLADVDGAGLQELILRANDSTYVLSSSQGTYQTSPVSYYPDSRPIGDVNGDDRVDFALRDTTDGAPYVAFGPASVADGLTLDLPVPNGSDDASGIDLADEGLGDLDDDGRDELVAGYSGDTQFGPRLLDLPEGASALATTDRSLNQEDYATNIGVQQTVNVGDWNGDGTDDVGFVLTDGAVEIYFGDPTQSITPDVTITGPPFPQGGATYSSVAAGDFTGNGTPNLAVAWNSDTQTVAVYEAGNGNPSFIHSIGIGDLGIPVDAPGIEDRASFQDFPNSVVANLGDVDNDGIDDLGVTVPEVEASVAHQVFLFLGGQGLSNQPDATIDYSDRAPGPWFGHVLRGIGDINGDGVDDFLVGDTFGTYSGGPTFPDDPIGEGFSGALFVHFGAPGVPSFNAPDQTLAVPVAEPLETGDFRINQYFGTQGIAVGDFNGDDTTDVAAKPSIAQFLVTNNGAMALRVFHGGSNFDGVPDAELSVPGVMDFFSGSQFATLSSGAVTGVPSASTDAPDRILLETWNPSNALLYGPGPDTTYALEKTTLLRGPDQSSGLGAGNNFFNLPQNASSAAGDFNGNGQANLILPQLQSVDFRGQPAYAYELGSGILEDPPPAASSSQPVDSSSTTVDFGESTGVDIAFSDATAGAGTVTVERFTDGASGPAGIDESAVSSYRVEISATDGLSVGENTEVRFDVSLLSGIDDPSRVAIYTRDLSGIAGFQATPTSYDDAANELVAQVSGFSEFVFASDTEPLPVEMAGFEAAVDEEAIRLSWQTAAETNNAAFQIQRRVVSTPGVRRTGERTSEQENAWTTVGSVKGAGSTSEAQTYRFTDTEVPYEANRLDYRLQQVDTDGSTSHSKTLTVERTVSRVELLGTYPNPARSQATVRYALPTPQEVTIRLYDVLGRQVETLVRAEQSGRHKERVDVRSLSSGVYFLRLHANGTVRTQKMTVVR